MERKESGKPFSTVYRRRAPEETLLHEVIRGHLETFLIAAQASGHTVPKFVEREMRASLPRKATACTPTLGRGSPS